MNKNISKVILYSVLAVLAVFIILKLLNSDMWLIALSALTIVIAGLISGLYIFSWYSKLCKKKDLLICK